MVSRAFCIPGVIFLVAAFLLNIITSISLPFLPAVDIARTHFPNADVSYQTTSNLDEIRFGIWAPCYYNNNDDRTCLKTGHAYEVELTNGGNTAFVKSSWTRGLAVHPNAAAVSFVALLLGLSTHVTVTLIASLVSFLAATLTFIAFAIDIALFALVRHEMKKLNANANTNTAPGFWLTFVAFILLLLAGCTVCFGRRRERLAGATSRPVVAPASASIEKTQKQPFWARFKSGSKV
ncbi:pali-domain-containing protein [Panaeolus papilionaceus]|nr:pali-domain-containing protein [Panaeolus papilionaceus]